MESSKPLDSKLEIGLWRADLTTPSLLATLGMESSSGKSLRKFLSTSMPASAVNNLFGPGQHGCGASHQFIALGLRGPTRMTVNPSNLDLPKSSGVYIFKTEEGEVLYVGKATNIRQRVRSYFSPNPDRAMIPTLVSRSNDVDFIITSGPREALVLEKQLIRKHKPRYNSAFKDDKSYPYIAYQGMKSLEFCTQGGLRLARRSGVHSLTRALRKGSLSYSEGNLGYGITKGPYRWIQ